MHPDPLDSTENPLMTEAAYYCLNGPLEASRLEDFAQLPGVEVTAIPQTDLHEHLVGFLGFISAIAGTSADPRVMGLMEFILAVGEGLEFKFDDSEEGENSQMIVREQLAPLKGIWLIADGVCDIAGRLIVDSEGKLGTANPPEVPEPRKSEAEFLYGALERERDQEDEGEEQAATPLIGRPLDECYKMIEAGCRKARSYGFTDLEDQFSFVSVMLEIGPNFDEHPEIKRILSDESIPVSERLDACVDHPDAERIWEEVAQMIDPEAWNALFPQ
jgi:hypothetical protein